MPLLLLLLKKKKLLLRLPSVLPWRILGLVWLLLEVLGLLTASAASFTTTSMYTTNTVVPTSAAVPVFSVTVSLAFAVITTSKTHASSSLVISWLDTSVQGMSVCSIRLFLETLHVNEGLLQFNERIRNLESEVFTYNIPCGGKPDGIRR